MPLLRRCGIGALLWILATATEAAPETAAAKLTINSGSGTINNSSTNTGGSFQLQNLSTGGQKLVSFKIDLRTAMMPDVVFDPAGTAGDPDGKAFEQDSFNGSGTAVHGFESPHDGIGSGDGYDILRLDFGPSVNFGPGDTMTFSADVDPTNVKGAPGPGPNHSASVSGLELIGATVTVTFSDGTVRSVRMGGVTGSSHSNKMSMGVLAEDNLATPVISVPGKTSPFVIASQPVVRVSGPAGAAGKLWVIHSTLYVAGVAGGGYDIDPFETNTAVSYGFTSITIGAGGFVDVPVTLTNAATGGINHVSVVLVDGSNRRSSCSNVLTIDHDPDGSGSDMVAPSVPADLAANGITAGSVTLVWSPSTDNVAVTGYRIFRNGVQAGTSSQASFTDSGRTPSTSYDYAVEAYDAAGNTSARALLTASTGPDQQDPSPPGSIHAIPGNGAAQITWGAASDDVGVTVYRVYRGGDLIGTVAALVYNDSGLTNGTAYHYEVSAIDAAGNESLPVGISVTPLAEVPALLRVNVGSESNYTDPQGRTWAADYGFNTGYTEPNTATILGTDKPALYQKRRIDRATGDELTYGFAVPDGDYSVVLHFVEVVASVSQVGGRVFDVTAEGALAVNDLDVFARVGANTACTVSFPVTVADGHLDLGFLHGVQNPVLSGIEVFPVVPVTAPPTFGEWLVSHGLDGQTTQDSDGGGAANLTEFELQMDPNDPADDLEFRIRCERVEGGTVIRMPLLKPIGNYHVHRSSDLDDLGNVANRIATVTRGEIELMTPQQRSENVVQDSLTDPRAFYVVVFEPLPE